MCHFGKIVVYRSRPGTHRACNQQAVAAATGGGRQSRCGVLPITSCEFTKKKMGRRRNASDALLFAALLQIISTGGWREEARTDRRASSPFPFSAGVSSSPACSARQPVRPIERATLSSPTHTKGLPTVPCRHRQKMR